MGSKNKLRRAVLLQFTGLARVNAGEQGGSDLLFTLGEMINA